MLDQKRLVRQRERTWKKYKQQHHWEALSNEKKKYRSIFKKARCKAISSKVAECKSNIKSLYNLVNNITGGVKENPLPECKNDKCLANTFADYFIEKIKKIREALDSQTLYDPIDQEVPTIEEFLPFTEEDIEEIIGTMQPKYCELDVIQPTFLKKLIPCIIKPITHLINTSISSGVSAANWKTAIIRPLLKKPSLDLKTKNYRPVSSLSFLSKLLEKCVLVRFNNHCKDNNLMPSHQSAYREHHSCETALVRLTNDLLWSIEKQRVTALVATDLSAAFDTVDHTVLLKVLQQNFGVKGKVLNWIDTYL